MGSDIATNFCSAEGFFATLLGLPTEDVAIGDETGDDAAAAAPAALAPGSAADDTAPVDSCEPRFGDGGTEKVPFESTLPPPPA